MIRKFRYLVTLPATVLLSGCLGITAQLPQTRPVDLAAPPPVSPPETMPAEAYLWPDSIEKISTAEKTAHSFTAADMPQEPQPLPASGPLELTVEKAVMAALANNRSLAVEQFGPAIAGTFIDTERAVFDPVLVAGGSLSRDTARSLSNSTGRFFSIDGNDHTISAGVEQTLPTGTDIGLDFTQEGANTDRSAGTDEARIGLNLTQALLRGARPSVNLAALRQAETGALASAYNLRGFAESLVAAVETTYWDYALARRQIEIFEESRQLAQRQLEETRSRIRVGQLAETDEAAANAELALRRQQMIDARSAAESARLQLLRLVNPPSNEGWDREIILKENELVPEVTLGAPEEHETLALQLRPDLNEARLRAIQGELETVQTADGLLPRLDLFVSLGRTGYARSVSGSLDDIGAGYDLTAGLDFELPVGNRAARAADRRARAEYAQARESVANLAQLVALDVRTALLEVERSLQQIEASAARRILQEEVLRAENARFSVGNTTALEVARVQRDLLESRISEIEAIVNYRKALINLYLLDGTLLLRRGIAGPGAEEVIF